MVVEAERLAAVGRRMVERAKAEVVVAAEMVVVVAAVMQQVVYACSSAAIPRLKAAVPTVLAWRFRASCSLPTVAPQYPWSPG